MSTRSAALTVDFALLASIYAVAFWVVHASILTLAPDLIGAALALDLIGTASVVHYLVGVRWAGLPSWTVTPVAIVGMVFAGALAPNLESMGIGVALFAAVELFAGGLAIVRSRTLLREYRQARADGVSRLDALERGVAVVTESQLLASLVLSEVRLVMLGLFGVFRTPPRQEGAFTCHREVGWMGLAGVLIFLAFIEIPLVHLGLDYAVGSAVAWAVTALSVYGVVWIWGDAQAMRHHPIVLNEGLLDVHVGMRWRARIPVSDIVSVERSDQAAPLDLSIVSPNVRLKLRRPVVAEGLFGWTHRGDEVSLRVDEMERFVASVEEARSRG